VARKFRATTDSEHNRPVAGNHLDRRFSVPGPNEVRVGDITYLWTSEGWLYLAVFIDLYSRLVVGWSLGTRLTTGLVLTAWQRERALDAAQDRVCWCMSTGGFSIPPRTSAGL